MEYQRVLHLSVMMQSVNVTVNLNLKRMPHTSFLNKILGKYHLVGKFLYPCKRPRLNMTASRDPQRINSIWLKITRKGRVQV